MPLSQASRSGRVIGEPELIRFWSYFLVPVTRPEPQKLARACSIHASAI